MQHIIKIFVYTGKVPSCVGQLNGHSIERYSFLAWLNGKIFRYELLPNSLPEINFK